MRLVRSWQVIMATITQQGADLNLSIHIRRQGDGQKMALEDGLHGA
jgi:hypothetical protein